jgi:exodeoxyribonuclease VII small subunit
VTDGADAAPKEALSYEQARDKLAAVVKRLETGGLTLEQSIELWERGERLAAVCEEWLDGARARLAAAMAQRDDAGRGDAGREDAGREDAGREDAGRDNAGRNGAGRRPAEDDAPF